jgi:hypothetical protein
MQACRFTVPSEKMLYSTTPLCHKKAASAEQEQEERRRCEA